ncbi:unnamed protein product [Symbiodinium natans]|uniref:C3H1-type domain-containing protein n=1 Tax=Symbiodinium natans TaxID=878477 RepID=A0A812RQY8_9DINO|nr:unnamed protein product [Symbiodinium natans]
MGSGTFALRAAGQNDSVDKTICVVRGLSLQQFRELTEEQKEAYRVECRGPGPAEAHQPGRCAQEPFALHGSERKDFLRKAGHPEEEPSQTSGQAEVRGEQASGSRNLPARPSRASSTTLMRRTVEMLEVTNLGTEKREKAQQLEEEEEPENAKQLEARIREIDEETRVLKERTKAAADRESAQRPRLTAETVLDQSTTPGLDRGKEEEKGRLVEASRRRRRGKGANEQAWRRAFDSRPVKEEEYHDEAAPGLETEAVEETGEGTLRVLSGQARQDEQRIMERKRVDLGKKRVRGMTEEKKEARKKRVKAASRRKEACRNLLWFGECNRTKCPFGHDLELVKKAKFSVCSDFSRAF